MKIITWLFTGMLTTDNLAIIKGSTCETVFSFVWIIGPI